MSNSLEIIHISPTTILHQSTYNINRHKMGPTTGTSSPVSKRSSPRNRSSPVLGNNSLSFKIIDHSVELSSTKNHPFIQNNSIPKNVTSPTKHEAVRNSPRNIVASIPSLEPKAYYSKSSLVDVNNPPQLKSSKKANNKPGLKPSSSSSRHGEKSRTKKSSSTKLLVAKLGQPLHRLPKTISVTNSGGSESLLQDLDNFFNDIDEGTKDMFDDVSSLSSISDNGEMDISSKDRSRRSSTPLSSISSSDGDTPLVTKMPTSHNKRRKGSSSEDPVLLKIKKIKPNPPAPLLNPIKIMNKGLGEVSSSSNNQPNSEESFRQEWRAQVSNDISVIRAGNGGLRFKFSTQNSSTKKKEDPFSLVKKSTRTSFSPKLGNDKIEDDKTAYNDDHCSTCLQIGQLMCCDSCTRAFHPSCLEEGYDFDRIPEGAWDCKVCRSKRSPMRKNPIISSASPQEKINSAFENLNHKIDNMNPKVFELPARIRNSFENVWTHPSTGDYINTDEYDVNVLPCRPGRAPRSHNKRKSSKTSLLSALARNTNNASSSDLPVFDNNNNVSSSTANTNTSDRKKIIPICFKCSKSDIKLRHENVLNSFKYGSTSRSTFPEKNTLDTCRMKLQSNTSPMIKCDYCDLHWHLDCLDPPLTVLPSSKTDETEIVDINSIRLMKLKTWGVESDMKDVEGLIELKKKWMCPCHADWKLPSERIEIEKEPTNKNQHRSLPTSPTKISVAKRTRPNASASASPASSPPPRKSSIRKTARALIILNDSEIKKLRPSAPSSSKIVIPIENKRVLNWNKHLVPEASVKLDFLSKVKSMKDLRRNNVSSSSRAEKLIVLPKSVESKLSTTFPKGLGEVYDFSSIQKLYSMSKGKGIAADVDNNVGPSSSLQAAEEVVHFTCNVDDHPAVNGLQCTRDEAAEWLSSITQLQQDVAAHLRRYLKDEI